MNLVLAVQYADVGGFPQGSVVSEIQATVTGTAAGNTTPVSQNGPPATPQFTFALTVADTYNYSVQAKDASGNGFGTAVTGSFVVTAPTTVTLSLPSTVVASQT
jgi:hypothetical protein